MSLASATGGRELDERATGGQVWWFGEAFEAFSASRRAGEDLKLLIGPGQALRGVRRLSSAAADAALPR